MAKLPRYLFPSDYMADPSANVFNGRLYIYPSHDWDAGECFDDDGGHFQMKDYHVLSWDDIENGEVTDHGVILDVKDVPWAEKQMWDTGCSCGRQARRPVQAYGEAHPWLVLHRSLCV